MLAPAQPAGADLATGPTAVGMVHCTGTDMTLCCCLSCRCQQRSNRRSWFRAQEGLHQQPVLVPRSYPERSRSLAGEFPHERRLWQGQEEGQHQPDGSGIHHWPWWQAEVGAWVQAVGAPSMPGPNSAMLPLMHDRYNPSQVHACWRARTACQ